MNIKEKQNIADPVGGESLESERAEANSSLEPISKSIQSRIDDLEKKKKIRRSMKMNRGGSRSPERAAG